MCKKKKIFPAMHNKPGRYVIHSTQPCRYHVFMLFLLIIPMSTSSDGWAQHISSSCIALISPYKIVGNNGKPLFTIIGELAFVIETFI